MSDNVPPCIQSGIYINEIAWPRYYVSHAVGRMRCASGAWLQIRDPKSHFKVMLKECKCVVMADMYRLRRYEKKLKAG